MTVVTWVAVLLLAALTASADAQSINYSTRTLDGVEVRVGAGEPVTLVAVFATWCSTCRAEFATLDSVARALAPRGVRVIGLSVDESGDDHVRKFVAARRTSFPVARDRSGAVGRIFGAVGVPEHFLVDSAGVVRWHGRGDLRAGLKGLRAALLLLVQERPVTKSRTQKDAGLRPRRRTQ